MPGLQKQGMPCLLGAPYTVHVCWGVPYRLWLYGERPGFHEEAPGFMGREQAQGVAHEFGPRTESGILSVGRDHKLENDLPVAHWNSIAGTLGAGCCDMVW